MRDYDLLTRRIEALASNSARVDTMTCADGYPVLRVSVASRVPAPTVLLIGGTHGDEPAGVEACLTVLEHDLAAWHRHFGFEVVPCLNPFGYVHNTRHNARNVDINWTYDDTSVPEVDGMKRLLRGQRFSFALDFHEDWESPGYYLYELRRNAPVMGRAVIHAVSTVCPINRKRAIDGWTAAGGLIAPDPEREVERRGAGLPLVLFFDHTDHLMTSESPSGLAMDIRVAAHRTALQTVLRHHLRHRRANQTEQA